MKKLIYKPILLFLFALLIFVPCAAWGATFGNTDTGGGSFGFNVANTVHVSKFTLSEDGTVSKLSTYVIIAEGTPHLKGVIFTDSSGTPADLLGVTPSFTCGVNWESRWIDLTFDSGIELSSGTYWIGTVVDGNGANSKWQSFSGSATKTSTDNSFTTPTDWDATKYTENAYALSIYATYTADGGGGTPPSAFPQILIFE